MPIKIPDKLILIALLFILGFTGLLFFLNHDNKLHIVFCNVGQGDAVYIKLPNQQEVLIDGGPDNGRVLTCLGQFMRFYDRTLDLVVLTHPQLDHYGGLTEVIKRYQVKKLVTVPVAGIGDEFTGFATAIHNQKVPVFYLTTGEKMRLGETVLTSVWPETNWLRKRLEIQSGRELFTESGEQKYQEAVLPQDDPNVFSLYLHLNYKEFDALFTGDGDRQTQEFINNLRLTNVLPPSIELLKAPHHGSKTAAEKWFADILAPKLTVILAGKKNRYGHPSKEFIDLMSAYGKVLGTYQDKSVEVVSDGLTWQVK